MWSYFWHSQVNLLSVESNQHPGFDTSDTQLGATDWKKFSFGWLDFVLTLAILDSKNCKLLDCWTENKDDYSILTKVNQENL